MSDTNPLDPLAIACYACELAGFDISEVPEDVLAAAQRGESFALSFDLAADLTLQLLFDHAAQRYEVEVHAIAGHRNEALVYSALQLNHELPRGSRRYSMEMFSGDVVLSDQIALAEDPVDSLALLVCDLMLGMSELLESVQTQASNEVVTAELGHGYSLRA